MIAVTFPLISWPLWLFLILPSQAVLVRRLHDVDRSGWWALPMPLLIFSFVIILAMAQFTLAGEEAKQILIVIGIVLRLHIGQLALNQNAFRQPFCATTRVNEK